MTSTPARSWLSLAKAARSRVRCSHAGPKICGPRARAAACMSLDLNFGLDDGRVDQDSAICVAAGISSCSSSSRFGPSSTSRRHAGEVAARPARLATRPASTGSAPVRRRSESSWSRPWRPVRRRCRRSSNHGRPDGEPDRPPSAGSRSFWPSAQRYSIATLLALDVAGFAQALVKRAHSDPRTDQATPVPRKPITGIAGCCARAASGQRRRAAEERDELPPPHSITSSARASSVAGVEPERLGGSEIDDELEFGRLQHRQVRRASHP